jgi:hypothetical protein
VKERNMIKVPTSTPNIPAEVLVREAVDLTYGDRVLYFRGGGSWAEIFTVIDAVVDDDSYVTVRYVFDNDTLDGSFVAWGRARFAVLTAGVCDNLHSGKALMCTPAPYRLDNNPWPGQSTVCEAHRQEMCAAQARALP